MQIYIKKRAITWTQAAGTLYWAGFWQKWKSSNSHFQLFFLSSFHLFATFVHTKPPGKSGNVVRRVEHLGRLRQQVLQGLAVILRLPERNLFVCLTWDNARCLSHDGCIEVVIQLWYRVAWLDDTTITAGPLSFWKFYSSFWFCFFLKPHPEFKVTWIGGVEGKDKSLLAPEEIWWYVQNTIMILYNNDFYNSCT